MGELHVPGIMIAYLVAGFAGGIVSLSYVHPTSFWRGLLSIVTSMIVANYLTGIAQAYLELRDPRLEHGVAFIVGLVGQFLITGIMKKAEAWSKDPVIPTTPPQRGPQ